MSELLEMLRTRRSIRKYTDEKVSEEKLEKIIQAGLLAFSGRNYKPWEMIVVRDKETLVKMSDCRVGAAKMLEGADCAIVVLAVEGKSDTQIEDCSIVMSNMHLCAHTLGLGSCWIQNRMRQTPDGITTEDYLRELLSFPVDRHPEAILSIGVPAEFPAPREPDDGDMTKVHYEKY